jgi:hypothetical protein
MYILAITINEESWSILKWNTNVMPVAVIYDTIFHIPRRQSKEWTGNADQNFYLFPSLPI